MVTCIAKMGTFSKDKKCLASLLPQELKKIKVTPIKRSCIMPKVISIWLWEAAKGNEFQRLRLLVESLPVPGDLTSVLEQELPGRS